jgi:multidrug resistance efflux pump
VSKAETELARIRPRGKEIDIKKAETGLSAAKRALDDAEHSYEDQKAHLQREETPYKGKFAKSFVEPWAKALDVRCGTAEMRSVIANQFLSVVDGLTDYDDSAVTSFKKKLEQYEAVQIE